MNFRLVSRILGLLLLLIALAMSCCLTVDVIAGWQSLWHTGLLSATIISIVCAVGLLIFGRGAKSELMRRESIAVVVLGWITCGIFGALPYLFSEPSLSPAAAFFESVSGFTTTGASVIEDIERVNKGILLWRSITQWLGAMGILVLFVALLSIFKLGGKSLFHHESSVRDEQITFSSIRRTAIVLWQIYTSLTVLCFLAYWAGGMTIFDAVNHAFTTLATGGFGIKSDSFAGYSASLQWVAISFMCIGSVNFLLYARWMINPKRHFFRFDEAAIAFFSLIFVATLAIAISRYAADTSLEYDLELLIRQSMFQVVSIASTSGYATDDFAAWPTFCQLVLLSLMFVGGCAGSTSGGMKVHRILAVTRIMREELIRYYRPRIVLNIPDLQTEDGKIHRRQILLLFALASLMTGLGSVLLALLEPHISPSGAISAIFACLYNVGPGLAEFGPGPGPEGVSGPLPAANAFTGLGSPALVLLSFLMIVGRLEFLAAMALLSRHFWQKY